MKGVAARYPAFNAARGRPVNLEQRINICRTDQQKATPFAPESKELLALTAYVAQQSRGLPIAVVDDERTRPFLEAGRATFYRRQGQLNFACANATTTTGRKSSPARPITQAQPTGYPIYRLEWQSLGSLQRRLRNCIVGMRVEPYASGCARVRRARALSDVARPRHDDRNAGRAAVTLSFRGDAKRRARNPHQPPHP